MRPEDLRPEDFIRIEVDEKLKPCPFCGGKAHLLNMGYPHWVFCSECGAKVQGVGFAEDGDTDAIERWNSRVEPTVEPTLYGYSIHHLAMVAMMLRDNSITPDSMRETLTNVQKMFELVWEEAQRKLDDVIRDWGGETDETD